MKDNIPKTKTKIIDKNNPWWTDKLQQERKILCMQTSQNLPQIPIAQQQRKIQDKTQ